jgi:hypothetical protein
MKAKELPRGTRISFRDFVFYTGIRNEDGSYRLFMRQHHSFNNNALADTTAFRNQFIVVPQQSLSTQVNENIHWAILDIDQWIDTQVNIRKLLNCYKMYGIMLYGNENQIRLYKFPERRTHGTD